MNYNGVSTTDQTEQMTAQSSSSESMKQNEVRATKPTRRGSRIWIVLGSMLVVAATLGILAGLAWWKYKEIEAGMNTPPPPEHPTTVGMEVSQTITWRNSTTSIGTILAPRSITVNNELPGTVLEVRLEPGSVVDVGNVLLRQDISVEDAQLKSAVAREAFTHSTLTRNEQLAETNAVTKLELEDFRSQWIQSQAQVEELKAVIARKTIKAPFRGRVGLSDIHEGQYLGAGSMITTLQSIEDHLLVDFMLPQGVDNQIQPGDMVTVVSSGNQLKAKVVALDAQADRSTRNVRIRATLYNPPERLSPGDSVQVHIEYGDPLTLPSVPAESVRRSPQGAFVFVAEMDKEGNLRAAMRPIMPGTSVGRSIGIAAGLKQGELVVVDGSFKLKDGDWIVPLESSNAGATSEPTEVKLEISPLSGQEESDVKN